MRRVDFQTSFLHVALPEFLKKCFRERILVPAPRRRIGVSADIFGIYDVPYEEGSETGSGRVCRE